jgi:uncharacterized protein YcaQ
MTAAIEVPPVVARRFMLRALLLNSPAANVAAAISHHAYIQIDPINVTGRMHDLILRNRVADYREGDLMRHLHGNKTPLTASERTAFEHHLPLTGILVAFPLDAWPHLQAANAARSRQTGAWSGRLTPNERELAKHVLSEIAARGPLRSAHFEDKRHSSRKVWGTMRLVKSTMQKLFFMANFSSPVGPWTIIASTIFHNVSCLPPFSPQKRRPQAIPLAGSPSPNSGSGGWSC